MGKTETTRLVLLRTAERMFAERGVDNVSLRELAAAAGQHNHSAVVYHFGSKRDLIEEMLHRHSGPIDASFAPSIERLRDRGEESLDALVRLLVKPLVDKLDDDDGGVNYLLICAELVSSRTFPLTGLKAANGPGAAELTQRLFAHIGDAPPMLIPVRMITTVAVLFGSIAAYHRVCAAGLFIPRADFYEDLVTTMKSVFDPSGRSRA